MIDEKGKMKISKYNKEDKQAFFFCYSLLALPFLTFILYWVCINLSSILYAFQDHNGKWSMTNFVAVFKAFAHKDQYGWNLREVLLRSFTLWILIDVVCIVPTLFSTYVLFKKIPGHYVFRTIFMVPSVIGGIVWVMIIKYMVNVDGPILYMANELDLNVPIEVLYKGFLGASKTAFNTIIIINILPVLLGFNMIVTGAFARIPKELFEVGQLDGLGFFREFFTISLPLIWPTLVIWFIGNLATIFTMDGGVFLFTMGAYDTATMGFYLYYIVLQVAESGADNVYGYPAALGVVLTCVTVPIVLFGKFVLEKAVEPVEY